MKDEKEVNTELELPDITIAEKSEEQIQARANLDALIPELQIEQEPPPSNASAEDSLYGLLSLLPIGLGFAGLKNTAAVWNDGTCRGVSAAVLPVLRKYAWGGKIINFLETGAGIEEMALFAVMMPVGLATYNAVQADILPASIEPDENDNTHLTPNPARTADYVTRN